jgi:hypothetical protein
MNGIGGLIGFPSDGTTWCYIQSFIGSYFPLTSMFWSTAIAVLLYFVSRDPNQEYSISQSRLQLLRIFCWSFPLFMTLLPLTTETFGKESDEIDNCNSH